MLANGGWTEFWSWVPWVLIGYFSGALPFSVWIGKLILQKDIRDFGDGNPGAANVFRAGNALAGILVLLLDISKAAAPVGIAFHRLGIDGFPMALIALAPVLGHMTSPFLRYKGGKALATALGVWIGLTVWKIPLVIVVSVVTGIALLTPAGWAVLVALGAILVALLAWMPDPLLFGVWIGEFLILTWTHRVDLAHPPRLRSWWQRRRQKSRQ